MSSECSSCRKGPPEVNIKRCAKCHVAPYCSRDCQKKDWKLHKKICAKGKADAPNPSSTTAKLSPPKGLDSGVDMPFTRLDKGTWLHDRSEQDVYRLLIDAHRLRQGDEFYLEHNHELYGGDPLKQFQVFLDQVQKYSGLPLLPSWWDQGKRQECESFASKLGHWHSLSNKIAKADVIEHYGDDKFQCSCACFLRFQSGHASWE